MEKPPKHENISPHDELFRLAHAKFIELFPDSKDFIDSLDGRKIVDGFVGDILSENKIPSPFIFHRLSSDEQRKVLEDFGVSDVSGLFNAVPEDLIAFYKEKIENPKPKISIDEIAEDV